MKNYFKEIIITIVLTTIIGVTGIAIHNNQMHDLFDKTTSTQFDIKKDSLEDILNNAKEIKVQKQIFSWSKQYYVSVDDVVVAKIDGKIFNLTGDKLIVRDRQGNIVKTEYQIKRFGPTHKSLFNISLDRLGEIQDASGKVTGFIGEKKLKDFFSLVHKQYFFSPDGKTLAQGTQRFWSKDFTITDNNDKTIYTIDGNLFSPSSKATIRKIADNDIDMLDVILYNIIEDSIMNGRSSSSSSSKKSK